MSLAFIKSTIAPKIILSGILNGSTFPTVTPAYLTVALTDTPDPSTSNYLANFTEVATAHGYVGGGDPSTASGGLITYAGFSIGGVGTISADPQGGQDDPRTVIIQATGGSIGPFRYIMLMLYVGVGNVPCFGGWDIGSEITLSNGDTLNISIGTITLAHKATLFTVS